MSTVRILILSLFSLPIFAKDCLVNRAFWEMGSSNTVVTVIRHDTCKKRVTIINQKEIKINYQSDILRSVDYSLSDEIVRSALRKMALMQTKVIKNYNPVEVIGFATGVFRQASNSLEVLSLFKEKLKFPIDTLSLRDEALWTIDYLSQRYDKSMSEIVLWDIGGSKSYMASTVGSELYFFESELGSEKFAAYMIQSVQFKNILKSRSPNPVYLDQYKSGIRHIHNTAFQEVHPFIVNNMKKPKTIVVGLGGVHTHMMKALTGKSEYTIEDVSGLLKSNLRKSDGEIKSKFPEHLVTNLMMLYGFMRALGIERVKSDEVKFSDIWINHNY